MVLKPPLERYTAVRLLLHKLLSSLAYCIDMMRKFAPLVVSLTRKKSASTTCLSYSMSRKDSTKQTQRTTAARVPGDSALLLSRPQRTSTRNWWHSGSACWTRTTSISRPFFSSRVLRLSCELSLYDNTRVLTATCFSKRTVPY